MVRSRFDLRRRGQVLLVGAVAIAFVLIGLAVLFNAVTFTGQTTVPDAGSSIDDATRFDSEVRRGARELVLRVNHGGVYGSGSALSKNVSTNVSKYSAVMGATYSAHGAVVNVSFDNSTSDYGRRVAQINESFLTEDGTASGNSTWQLVDRADQLGWFVLTINGTSLPGNPGTSLWINVTNSSNEYVKYKIYKGGSSTVNVTVDTTVGSSMGPYQFKTTRGHVVFNLLDGTSPMNRSARMPAIRRLDGPYNVTFENGDSSLGQYSIVVNSAGAIEGTISDCSSSATPCHGPAIWNATVRTAYVTSKVHVSHNQTITVYNSSS
jgi:hypothetical protein